MRLAPEPRRCRLILPPPLLVHHLDHGHAPELKVLRAIHFPVATASDLLSEDVVT
jgi:hypothetical protein